MIQGIFWNGVDSSLLDCCCKNWIVGILNLKIYTHVSNPVIKGWVAFFEIAAVTASLNFEITKGLKVGDTILLKGWIYEGRVAIVYPLFPVLDER